MAKFSNVGEILEILKFQKKIDKILNFLLNYEILAKLWNFSQIVKFRPNSDISAKFWYKKNKTSVQIIIDCYVTRHIMTTVGKTWIISVGKVLGNKILQQCETALA